MPAKLPKVGSTYYFRLAVPEHLRPYLRTSTGKPRTEFMISLREKDLKKAKSKWLAEAIRVEALIGEAQRLFQNGVPPSDAQAFASRQVAWEHQQFLGSLEDCAEQDRRDAEEQEDDEVLRQWLDRPYAELTQEERTLKRNLDPFLFEEPLVTEAKLRAREKAWDEGAAQVAVAVAALPTTSSPFQSPTSFKSLFQRYVAATSVAPATQKRWEPVLSHFAGFVGHDDASRVTAKDVFAWRNYLLTEETPTGLRSRKTIRDTYLSALKAVFTNGVDEGVLNENVAASVKVRLEKKTILREDRGFSDAEASLILKGTLQSFSEQLTPPSRRARRWVPWVCAYTGARVNEITQLREMDIFQVDDIWVIHITPEAGTVKNRKARTVPLHPHLIEQGFHTLGVGGSERPIFYNPALAKGGSAANPHFKKVGERIGEWVRGLGVTDPDVAPNHGWRHLFRTRGYEAGLSEAALEWLCGHAPSTEARGYGFRYPKVLVKEIERFPRFSIEGV